jgi:hypothetical protein
MKKFKLLALAFVIGTASLFATNGENGETPEKPKKEIRTQLVQLLDSPKFVVQNEMNVTIIFTFNSEGKIVVLSVNSKDSDILNYIRKNLNGQTIQNPGERDKLYSMPLKVKQI